MSYSCSDFTDSILEALGVTVPDDDADNPSAQADLALAAIAKLQKTRKEPAVYKPVESYPSVMWAVAYHTNSHAKRAKRWYRISRIVYADAGFFELYWHPDTSLRGGNVEWLVKIATDQGIALAPGLFHDKQGPRRGSEMERV